MAAAARRLRGNEMTSDRLRSARVKMDEARRRFERASMELFEAESAYKTAEFFEGKDRPL
jgi:hypothetical protein